MLHPLFNAVVAFATAEAPRRAIAPAALTRWPWPERDPAIEDLSDADRRQIASVWAGRCHAEVDSVAAFGHIAESLERIAAPPAVIALAKRAISDERRHIEICRRVASAYAGAEMKAPPLRAMQTPAHAGADGATRALLHVIGQCCLNETTACAFAHHSYRIATAPLVRAATREIFADEIDHARIGWAALAATPHSLRGRAASWMPKLIESHVHAWRVAAIDSPPSLIAHGAPLQADARRIVSDALDQLILPGFQSLRFL